MNFNCDTWDCTAKKGKRATLQTNSWRRPPVVEDRGHKVAHCIRVRNNAWTKTCISRSYIHRNRTKPCTKEERHVLLQLLLRWLQNLTLALHAVKLQLFLVWPADQYVMCRQIPQVCFSTQLVWSDQDGGPWTRIGNMASMLVPPSLPPFTQSKLLERITWLWQWCKRELGLIG